jgi:hypothetical protein
MYLQIFHLVLNTHIHQSFLLAFHNFHPSSQVKNMKFIHLTKTQFTNLINIIFIYHYLHTTYVKDSSYYDRTFS